MSEFEDDDGEEMKISDYNSALFINKRINDLWEDANKHKRRGMYLDWNGDLDAVWCELAGDVDAGSEKEKEFHKLSIELGTVAPLINWNKSVGFMKLDNQGSILKAKQFKMLMDKEIFLRRLQNEQGKGTKYRDDLSDYMDM